MSEAHRAGRGQVGHTSKGTGREAARAAVHEIRSKRCLPTQEAEEAIAAAELDAKNAAQALQISSLQARLGY